MSVEPKKAKVFEVDLGKLQAFFVRTNSNGGCPMCKTNAWKITGKRKIVGVTLPYGDGGPDLYTTGLPALLLTCKNCAFIRLLDLDACKEVLIEVDDDSVE